jgi:acetyl esterase
MHRLPTLRLRVEAAVPQRLFALPEPLVRRLIGRPLVVQDQALEPHVELACRLARVASRPPLSTLSPSEARADYHVSVSVIDRPGPTLPKVRDLEVAGADGPLRARVYWPRLHAELPLLVYLHGGGYVIGDLDTHDGFCRRLAREADVCVAAVDYRLAPEHPFPAPFDDALAAFRDLASRAKEFGADPSRVMIAGDSAGATLSAAVTQATAGHSLAPALALLFYPSTEHGARTVSRTLFREGFLLDADMIDFFMRAYGAPREDVRVSPLLADSLEGLPPHIVVTAGYDPLRDEGRAYAEALEAAGVHTRHIEHPGLVHGWVHMAALPGARRATGYVCDVLRAELKRLEGSVSHA